MADLYPVLLKSIDNVSFGANLMNIIALRKGEVIVKTKKLLVTYDGEKQEPVDCQLVEVKFEGDNIILNIVPAKNVDQLPAAKDTPQTKAIIPAVVTDKFILQGDDLEALEALSDFRKKENIAEKTDNSKLVAYTLESGAFDIQDLTSVQNAVLDIIEKEKQLIDKGYKVFKTNIPRFDYENINNFRLIESAVLIKSVAIVNEKK